MVTTEALEQLERSATDFEGPEIRIFRAKASLNERQDGEEVTRVVLLLSDPAKDRDTWDVSSIRKLRLDLGRRAAELQLPPVSLSLVPEAEARELDVFHQ